MINRPGPPRKKPNTAAMIGFFCVLGLAVIAIVLAIVLTGAESGTTTSATTVGKQDSETELLARNMVDILNSGDVEAVKAIACGQEQTRRLALIVNAKVGYVVGDSEQVDKDTVRTGLDFADPERGPRPSLIMTMKTWPSGRWCVESLEVPS